MDTNAVNELAKWLVSLGVGGAIAALIFAFYRKDVKQYTELWKEATNQMMGIVKEVVQVIKENTASNIKLISLIESQERNALRKTDIVAMIDEGLRTRLVELSWPKVEKDMSGRMVDEK